MIDDDEELAHEFLLGIPGPDGREFPKPGSERELKARTALAKILFKEAPNGYFTRLMAALIDPPRRSVIIKRKIVFKRPRGTPVVVGDRRRAEIAAFIHARLKNRTGTQSLKSVLGEAEDKFGVRRSTLLNIWSHFRPPKGNGGGRRSPNK
jgi:hypothetical protein